MRRAVSGLLVLASLTGISVSPASSATGFTARDVGALTDQTSWSPDGRWIAYLRPRRFDPGTYDLVLVAPDGSLERSLGSGGSGAWSPDGRRILISDNDFRFRVVDLASNQTRSLGTAIDGFGGLDWSPDGERLAYVKRGLAQTPVYVSAWDGSDPRLLVSDGYQPAWSPDGQEIAFSHDLTCVEEGPLEIIRSDGTQRRIIERPGEARAGARWSPEGGQVAFSTSPLFCTSPHDRIYLVGGDGQGERLLAETPFSTRLAWSPNGRWLAVMNKSTYRDIILMSTEGIGERSFATSTSFAAWAPEGDQVTFQRDGSIFAGSTSGVERRIAIGSGADWSPDGRQISYLSAAYDNEVPFRHCDEQVFVVSSDGRDSRPVSPCWQTGTLFRDLLQGTRANDVTDAYLDNDRVYGGEGDDLLRGWGGNDRLYGGPGEDLLRGGRGADRLGARDGQLDVVVCGPGRDVVVADAIDLVDRDCEVVRRRSA